MNKRFVVAIDGIAGSGKSTVASLVAKKLGVSKLNTGDIYRAVTIKYLNTGFKLESDDDAKKFVKILDLKIAYDELNEQHTYLDGVDVTERLHDFEVSDTVSKISGYKSLREHVTKIQRKIAKQNSIVVEGRDIGSHVLPNADYKIFLTASVKERAKRQYNELKEKGDNKVTLKQLEKSIFERDYNDTHREYGAIVVSKGAKVIDTSKMTIDEVVSKVLDYIKGKN